MCLGGGIDSLSHSIHVPTCIVYLVTELRDHFLSLKFSGRAALAVAPCGGDR